MELLDLLALYDLIEVVVFSVLLVIAFYLKGIFMDTKALRAAFDSFAVAFPAFAADLAKFVSTVAPQDTPEQIADVKTVTDGLTNFTQQVTALDSLINPPAGGAPPPPPAV